MAGGLKSKRVPEKWRDIVGYEGYYMASSLGRIKRIRPGRGATAGRILRQKRPTRFCNYARVQLCRRDIKRTIFVHLLVAEAFHGKRPRSKFVNHKDLDKNNNRADNLEWLTRKQNLRHAILLGRKPGRPLFGVDNGRAKLTYEQVHEIRAQKGRIGQRALATLCGVSKSAIQFIHQGKHWREDAKNREFPHGS